MRTRLIVPVLVGVTLAVGGCDAIEPVAPGTDAEPLFNHAGDIDHQPIYFFIDIPDFPAAVSSTGKTLEMSLDQAFVDPAFGLG